MVVGTPLANRNYAELENLIGFFSNPLALRTRLAGDPTFRELVARVNEVSLEAHAHQEIPFQKLVDELRLKRDLGHHPLFQISFTLDTLRPRPGDSAGLKITPLEMPAATVQHDLTLHMADTGAGLTALWQYSTDLYDAATVEQLAGEFALLVAHAGRRPEARLSELTALLAGSEREQRGERAREAAAAGLQKLKTVRRRAVGAAAESSGRGAQDVSSERGARDGEATGGGAR
jgi:non-ribosomal peptide synthetase component F